MRWITRSPAPSTPSRSAGTSPIRATGTTCSPAGAPGVPATPRWSACFKRAFGTSGSSHEGDWPPGPAGLAGAGRGPGPGNADQHRRSGPGLWRSRRPRPGARRPDLYRHWLSRDRPAGRRHPGSAGGGGPAVGARRGRQRIRVSLATVVQSLADNKQLLGLRYAEWCPAAPTLEADIAGGAMGLDDLGHSRVLHGSLRGLGEADAERDPTSPEHYLNVAYLDQPWSNWNQFVAANAVLDTAFTLMIEALANGKVEVLRSRLRKMLQEGHS